MAKDPSSCLIIDDDLLDFTLDDDTNKSKPPSSSSFDFSNPNSEDPDDYTRSFPEFAEEELEWLSNEDAFPAVETCFDLLSNSTLVVVDHHSPVSVLINSTNSSHSNSNSNTNSSITSCCGSLLVPISYPVRKRSKRRHRGRRVFPELPGQQCWRWNKMQPPPLLPEPPTAAASGLGRRCQHCLAEKTPQWRAGPMGPKTLCNACGVRYKSGRLVPEYRPASSPTFSNELHSNSHRKIIEMRRVKQEAACGYGVG